MNNSEQTRLRPSQRARLMQINEEPWLASPTARGIDSTRSATWPIDHRRRTFDDDLITIAKDVRRIGKDARAAIGILDHKFTRLFERTGGPRRDGSLIARIAACRLIAKSEGTYGCRVGGATLAA